MRKILPRPFLHPLLSPIFGLQEQILCPFCWQGFLKDICPDAIDECPTCHREWAESVDLRELGIAHEIILTSPFALPCYNICRRWHLCQHCWRSFDFDIGTLTLSGLPNQCPECGGKWTETIFLEDL